MSFQVQTKRKEEKEVQCKRLTKLADIEKEIKEAFRKVTGCSPMPGSEKSSKTEKEV
jgi:hypothetical protein